MTAYKKVPNSNIEVPVWMDASALTKPISNALRQDNAEKMRLLKAELFPPKKQVAIGGERCWF